MLKHWVLFVLLGQNIIAQLPDTIWSRTYGGPSHDIGSAVRLCADTGYILCGSTSSFGAGGWDMYLIRTDDKGDTLWTRTYGGADNDGGFDVAATPEGGYIAVGYTNSFGAGGRDVYIVRVDSLGDTLWTRTYGGPLDDEANSIQPTPDRGYVIGGTTYSFGAGLGDVYLMKMDSLGDSLWAYTYGGALTDQGKDAVVLDDSCLVLCGSTWSYGAGREDAYLIKTDPKGDTLWTRTHGGESTEAAYDIAVTSGGGMILSGASYFSLLGYEIFVFKTDPAGNVQWNYFNGSLNDDYGYAVGEIPGRGYVIGGNFSYELFLIRTDTAGSNYQQWIFGGAGTDCATDLAIHPDGSYALVGNTTSFGHGQTDIWLIRVNRDTLGAAEPARSQRSSPLMTVSPNPFRKSTKICAGRGAEGKELKIFDSTGRVVQTITLNATPFALCWSGTDQAGRPLPAGVYFICLRAGQEDVREKLVLIR